MKKLLIATGGGDCPGLNAVIRGIAKAARAEGIWDAWGTMEAFNGVFSDPPELVRLTPKRIAGIHVKGGTIIKTTNLNDPRAYPVQQADGSWKTFDRTGELVERMKSLGFDALVNIGGDGSQRISQALIEKGMNVVGVPKTIDNDLMGTDLTFGFSTAVQIASESLDKLVTTAESHHRVMLMEVMGRDAGWIALHTAIAGGAEICLIPEIPFHIDKVLQTINKRYHKGKGFANIVIAEGAKPAGGAVIGKKALEVGDQHIKLGGVANYLQMLLEEKGCPAQIRTTVLGHIQRGGIPIAFDRILASAMGVKAYELVRDGVFGTMVSYQGDQLSQVPVSDAVKGNKILTPDHYLLRVARSLGISFGD
ncbi:MAG: Pyrophosphate--fructose 6-phosphate 1-phosphotransferase [Haliscomenobacter sp.]|nr:Pyrophosphate--fructose 6-phosphate 1-phosphotransferase [Haliscomenobacter sp.]